MGERRAGGFKARMGRERCISIGGQMDQVEQWRITSWRSAKRKTQCW